MFAALSLSLCAYEPRTSKRKYKTESVSSLLLIFRLILSASWRDLNASCYVRMAICCCCWFFLSLILCYSHAFFASIFFSYVYLCTFGALFICRAARRSFTYYNFVVDFFISFIFFTIAETNDSITSHVLRSMYTAAAANTLFLSLTLSILIKISKFYTQIIYLLIFSVVFNSVMSLFDRPLWVGFFFCPMHNVNRNFINLKLAESKKQRWKMIQVLYLWFSHASSLSFSFVYKMPFVQHTHILFGIALSLVWRWEWMRIDSAFSHTTCLKCKTVQCVCDMYFKRQCLLHFIFHKPTLTPSLSVWLFLSVSVFDV